MFELHANPYIWPDGKKGILAEVTIDLPDWDKGPLSAKMTCAEAGELGWQFQLAGDALHIIKQGGVPQPDDHPRDMLKLQANLHAWRSGEKGEVDVAINLPGCDKALLSEEMTYAEANEFADQLQKEGGNYGEIALCMKQICFNKRGDFVSE